MDELGSRVSARPAADAGTLAPAAAPASYPGTLVPGTPGRGPASGWRPGTFWYWLAVLMLLAGIAWPLAGMRLTDARIASFQRVPLPAGGRVVLPHAGSYVISYEAAGASQRSIPAFRVTARPLTRSLRLALLADRSGTVYASGGRQGIAVLGLKVSGPGAVFLSGPGAPAVPGGSVLAVGAAVPGFGLTIVPGIALMLGGIAFIVLIATLRSRGSLMRIRYPSLGP